MAERKGDWMITYTGGEFWPLDPRPEEINMEDIAHSLALLCRFNGHCQKFYSVAQHSVIVSQIVNSPRDRLPALLHDAAESYIGDIIIPFKNSLNQVKKIEKEIMDAVHSRFGVGNYDADEVKRADKIALFAEMRELERAPETGERRRTALKRKTIESVLHSLEPEKYGEYWEESSRILKDGIIPLSPEESEELFLKRYEELKTAYRQFSA